MMESQRARWGIGFPYPSYPAPFVLCVFIVMVSSSFERKWSIGGGFHRLIGVLVLWGGFYGQR